MKVHHQRLDEPRLKWGKTVLEEEGEKALDCVLT